MPDKGTVVPLPPTAKRLEEAKTLETPQSFVPGTSVSAGQSWQAAGPARKRGELNPITEPNCAPVRVFVGRRYSCFKQKSLGSKWFLG